MLSSSADMEGTFSDLAVLYDRSRYIDSVRSMREEIVNGPLFRWKRRWLWVRNTRWALAEQGSSIPIAAPPRPAGVPHSEGEFVWPFTMAKDGTAFVDFDGYVVKIANVTVF